MKKTAINFPLEWINVTDSQFGAVGDARLVFDFVTTNGSSTVTSSTANFQTAVSSSSYYVGKYIRIAGAGSGGSDLITTISSVVNNTTITISTPALTSFSSTKGIFGTDNRGAIQNAINSAKTRFKNSMGVEISTSCPSVVYVPSGNYLINGDLGLDVVSNSDDGLSVVIMGANAQPVNKANAQVFPAPGKSTGVSFFFNPNSVGASLFKFKGPSGTFSNSGLSNISIIPFNDYWGTGIYLDGSPYNFFENIRILKMRIGIYLHNATNGSFTEINKFNRIQLQQCDEGIRVEKTAGNDSFHGNEFNDVYFNIGPESINRRQVGVNLLSGYFYNCRFRFYMWACNKSAEYFYIGKDMNGEECIGDFTYEAFGQSPQYPQSDGYGRITGPTLAQGGSGKLWFSGFMRGIGAYGAANSTRPGLIDLTIPKPSESFKKSFACDNYWKLVDYGTSGRKAGPLPSANESFNGVFGYFQAFESGPNGNESVLLNVYDDPSNGLYIGRTSWAQSESGGQLGFFIAGDGSKIKSFNNLNGLQIQTNTDISGYTVLSGYVTIAPNGTMDIITFNNFIGGQLIITTENFTSGSNNPSSVYNLGWGQNANNIQVVLEAPRNISGVLSYLKAQFTAGSPNKLQIKNTNTSSGIVAWWFYNGVKF